MLTKKEFQEACRQAVADYMRSERCTCCQDYTEHKKHEKRLAELLDVPSYPDGSGYDFSKFEYGEVLDA